MNQKTLLGQHQYHIDLSPGDVGRYVLLPGDPKRCKKIADYLNNPTLMADHREYVTYTGTLDGVKVSVTSTGIGGPSTAIAVEELKKIGADTFIRIGTCGGIDLQVEAGNLVVPNGAIRKEGTGREYTPIEYPAVPDFQVVTALVAACRESNRKFHIGVVECKDSFYGQHDPASKPVSYELLNKWEAWKRAGALASEMESAALYIVSSYLRTRAGTILMVVNNQERVKQGLSNTVVTETEEAIATAVQALRLLIKQDQANNSL